jgi:Zn-dependent protease with chaperone function
MKLVFLGVFLTFLVLWALWNASLTRLWRRIGARSAVHFPVWRRLRERLFEIARRERFAVQPRLWIVPDFAPNVIIAKQGRAVHIAVTEGLLRSLDDDELDAVLSLCLAHGRGGRRRWQTLVALQLFPFACLLQGYPTAVQIFLSPWLTALQRLVSPPARVFRFDRQAGDELAVAAALQKMAVLGRKIPLRRWNLALDPLFLVSPLALDGGPFWIFLSQPSVEERRRALLLGASLAKEQAVCHK